jgi:hypothetical protein
MLGRLWFPTPTLPVLLRRHYNRVRRGLLAFVPRLIHCDDSLAQETLTAAEYALFQQMDVRDRQHALWVARAVLEHTPHASHCLVAAALLHDVGKCDAPFRPLERIIVHLLTLPAVPPAYPRLSGWRGAWQRKCHHERYGAQRIHHAGGRARVAAIVAACHQDTPDPEARLLAYVDGCF